jgi:diacylglycerol kinase
MKRFGRSFAHAFDGIVEATRSQRNLAIQLVTAAVVVPLALALHVRLQAFATLFVLAALVLALELVNTAIEALVDLASPGVHPLAKRAKDAAAGAVLVAAVGAAVAGATIFYQAVTAVYQAPSRPTLDVQTVAGAVLFWAVAAVLAKAWLGVRLRGLAALGLLLLLAAGAVCLCLLAHDPRML